jgi:hypothetical protein
MITRTIATGLVLAAVLAAGSAAGQPAAPRTVATLTGVEGNVLVSEADAMVSAGNGQRLAPGARVLITAGAKATVAYDKGCTVLLGVNQRYTVRERAECARARAPQMGKVEEFTILAGAAVRNVGETVVTGEVGVSPGAGVVGFPPGKVSGKIHPANDVAEQAQKDAAKVYAELAQQECNVNLAGQDLGGLTLTPGVYCFPGAAQLTGELVLDAQGDRNAVFVFQVGTTLTTAARSLVRIKDDGREDDDGKGRPADERQRKRGTLCHVYWQVGNAVTLGRESFFLGNLFAIGTIDMANRVEFVGRALSRTGQVLLDTDNDTGLCLPVAGYYRPAAAIVGAGALAVGASAIEANRKPKSPN